MGSFKPLICLCCILYALLGTCFSVSYQEAGKIIFLIQHDQQEQAIALYQQRFKEAGVHDFELLHRIGLAVLEQGFRQSDPEIQLLTLFGASLSIHNDAYYILEESLKNKQPQIQLVALRALACLQSDRADKALQRALSSDYLLIRLEALNQLCLKRHPEAIAQAESLMYKMPAILLPVFPQFFATSSQPQAVRHLRKLLNHYDQKVRLQAILSIIKYKRDDFLPQLRRLLNQLTYNGQEACATALGIFRDEASAQKLEALTASAYPQVSLAACLALYRMGREEAGDQIKEKAQEGDPFAISLLGEIEGGEEILVDLLHHSNMQVRLNATVALLEKNDSSCLEGLQEFLIRNKQDFGFTQMHSPGRSLEAWKAVPSASQVLKDDATAYCSSLEFREELLTKACHLPEQDFLKIASLVFRYQQNALIPHLISLLEEINSPGVIEFLKTYQHMVGAPLVRQYCTLALYRLQEEGSYGEQLRQWVENSYDQALIRFRPMKPWDTSLNDANYQLTPEETSALLVETFQAFAANQDSLGVEVLLEAIRSGHKKNRYALAGLLLRAID
jgi:HEAT repeat protein